MNIKKIAKVAIPVALMVVPFLTFAALIPAPTNPVNSTNNALTLAEIQSLIETIARFLMIIAIIVAVVFIVWGAIVYMSGGERAEAGKKWIWSGIIGAAVVFAVGIILQTVAGLVTRAFFS
jgi:hypothetical protein